MKRFHVRVSVEDLEVSGVARLHAGAQSLGISD